MKFKNIINSVLEKTLGYQVVRTDVLEKLLAKFSTIEQLEAEMASESWHGSWFYSQRWHTLKELSKGVAAIYGYGVEGDVAEFGTMTGVSSEGLAHAIARNDEDFKHALPPHLLPKKKLFLFDSFEGLPETDNQVDAESLHVKQGVWAPGTCQGLSQKQLAGVVGKHLPADRYQILPGWFKDTVPALPQTQKFGLIHVDGDLYSSTMDCLTPLFERGMVSEGALIYFDDWGPNRSSPKHGERRAWNELVERFDIEFSDDGSYGLLCHRFIIHSYQNGSGQRIPDDTGIPQHVREIVAQHGKSSKVIMLGTNGFGENMLSIPREERNFSVLAIVDDTIAKNSASYRDETLLSSDGFRALVRQHGDVIAINTCQNQKPKDYFFRLCQECGVPAINIQQAYDDIFGLYFGNDGMLHVRKS